MEVSFNSVENIPALKAAAVFNTNSREVFREDNDISPVTLFPHFYTPVHNQTTTLQNTLYKQLQESTNAQIRALTGGDITKEPTILKMDTHRALTELDAKAREAEQLRKIK